LYDGVLIIPYPDQEEASYGDQTRDLFDILPTKFNTLLRPLLQRLQATQNNSEACLSNQVSEAAMTSAPEEEW
jgi:hypothetical protein